MFQRAKLVDDEYMQQKLCGYGFNVEYNNILFKSLITISHSSFSLFWGKDQNQSEAKLITQIGTDATQINPEPIPSTSNAPRKIGKVSIEDGLF